jgi:single-strand DNA-binding protein
MGSPNQITLWGNLTREPELRILPSGVAVCNCGMAVNRSWTDKQGNKKEDVDFFNLAVYGDAAENVAVSLGKGDRVVVVGRMRITQAEDSNGGPARHYHEINVEEIGPTLRWAEVDVRKNQKNNSGSSTNPMEAQF